MQDPQATPHRPLQLSPENLRHILGLKLRNFRLQKNLGLKELSRLTGVSVSYLSEIEKGKKYPKPDKLLQLAAVLEVSYDALVSPVFDGDLAPMTDIFASPFLREFPFSQYGIELESIFNLLADVPNQGSKAGALVRTALEIGRVYDLEVEHFLLAALRSYQHLHANRFEAIEAAARRVRREQGWGKGQVPEAAELEAILSHDFGYTVDSRRLAEASSLKDARAVTVAGEEPRLLVNGRLLPSQQAFMLGRELGYRVLDLKERSMVSPPLRVESYDQVIHDFMAAYFSGALLIDGEALNDDLERFFARRRWSERAFLQLVERYRSTPETFFYRLSQLLPTAFGLRRLFFLRFSHRLGSETFRLTKVLNMSSLPFPIGARQREHFCRRWPGIQVLRQLVAGLGASAEDTGSSPPADGGDVRLAVQRSRFLWDDEEYLVITLSRPLALTADTYSSVSLGWHLDEEAKERVAFWQDKSIARRSVHMSCERCPLSDVQCEERAAPASILEAAALRRRQERELEALGAEG